MVVHSFCNAMGFPTMEWTEAHHPLYKLRNCTFIPGSILLLLRANHVRHLFLLLLLFAGARSGERLFSDRIGSILRVPAACNGTPTVWQPVPCVRHWPWQHISPTVIRHDMMCSMFPFPSSRVHTNHLALFLLLPVCLLVDIACLSQYSNIPCAQ